MKAEEASRMLYKKFKECGIDATQLDVNKIMKSIKKRDNIH